MNNGNQVIATSIAKKNELELLKSKISRVELQIQKLTARAATLTQKQSDFTQYLSIAQSNKETARANDEHAKKVVNSIKETFKKIKQVIGKTKNSNDEISSTSFFMAVLMKDLVYSVELIDALALSINKKKATNALIPDDLVSAITTASSDANNAVALCLTALESSNVAMATSDQANEITFLELIESLQLYGLITGFVKPVEACVNKIMEYKRQGEQGIDFDVTLRPSFQELLSAKKSEDSDELPVEGRRNIKNVQQSLIRLLSSALIEAKQQVDLATEAKQRVDQELEQAKGALDRESSILNSLKAGLAAANAAALAA